MKLNKQRLLTTIAALVATTTLSAQAVITSVNVSTPIVGETGDFSDGGGDYFGVVTSNDGGVTKLIAGSSFSPNLTTPPVGSLAGRDHDDNGARPETRTAEWTLNIATIPNAVSPFTNISFSGSIAARDDDNAWDNSSPNVDFVTFELLLDNVVLASQTKDFRSTAALGAFNGNLALDTNGDGVGDGTVVSSTTPQAFSMTGTTANSTIVVRVTARSESSNEEFWVNGTLSADVDVVPEPSSSLMLLIASGLLVTRRKR